ncbi:MAG: NAD(P)-dependent oxidoreductase [Patescibacteria group bacterium]
MAKILFTELEGWEEADIKAALPEHDLVLKTEPLKDEDYAAIGSAEIVAPFIYTPITAEVMAKLPNLKLIATRSTGFDHIDVAAAKSKGITVCNVPFYGENTVAEHAWALILALSRNICTSYDRTKAGSFSFAGLRGFDLKDKTLGIIGGGHIGQHVARMAQGFAMKVLVFDPKQDESLATSLGFSYVSLAELLKKSDVITLHAPYNDKTHHLLNRDNLRLMKPSAILVNTARGGLIDTLALAEALKGGRLAGAGLDVLEEESYIKEEIQLLSPEFHKTCDYKTLIANHILLEMPNVIITPHNAFNSQESIKRILNTTLDNIKAYLAGQPINTVHN